jgi:general L-amino acid transport system substrate-binding protein
VNCAIDSDRSDLAGFDTDLCRAIAAALFDDPDRVRVTPRDPIVAAAALRAGDADVYLGPTDLGPSELALGPTLFFDATGAIARTDVGITQLADLKFTTVCLIQDSIDEQAFNAAAQEARVPFQSLLFNAQDVDVMYSRYDQGHCDAIVDNRVRLARQLPTLSDPRGQGLIEMALITGRRGLVTASTDTNWSEIVAAIAHGLVRAEELGVNSATLEAALAGDDPAVRQLLGVDGEIGTSIGLAGDFVARIIAHLGNYGEIYDRHFGDLPRGPNALFVNGGSILVP